MPEIKLYINDDVHTGQIREASFLLSRGTLRIVNGCLDEVRDLEDRQIDQDVETALRIRILKADNVSPKLIRRWKKDESWVFKLLGMARQFTDPDKIDQRLLTILEPRPIPTRPMDALVFFGTMKKRLEYLSSDQAPATLPTIPFAVTSLAESRILHQALYGRRYLVKATDPTAA